MIGLPGWERSWTISSAVWIQYTDVTDRRTDGRTEPGNSKDRALRLASRGFNSSEVLTYFSCSVSVFTIWYKQQDWADGATFNFCPKRVQDIFLWRSRYVDDWCFALLNKFCCLFIVTSSSLWALIKGHIVRPGTLDTLTSGYVSRFVGLSDLSSHTHSAWESRIRASSHVLTHVACNNNTNICKAHIVSIRAESEAYELC